MVVFQIKRCRVKDNQQTVTPKALLRRRSDLFPGPVVMVSKMLSFIICCRFEMCHILLTFWVVLEISVWCFESIIVNCKICCRFERHPLLYYIITRNNIIKKPRHLVSFS